MSSFVEVLNAITTRISWDALWQVILRSMIVLLAALLVAKIWRRASAAQRHLVLSVGCLIAITLPVFQLAIPTWDLPILPVTEPLLSAQAAAAPVIPGTLANLSPALPAIPPVTETVLATRLEHPWLIVALLIWGIGFLAVTVSLWISHRYVRNLLISGTPVTDSRLLAAASHTQDLLGLPYRVQLVHSTTTIPLAYGIRRPFVALPLDAAGWDDERLHSILIHEMAHILRADCLTQLATSAMCAMYWFNPYAWMIARELREQREHACDDHVLAAGRSPSAYAAVLLDFANSIRGVIPAMRIALTFARIRHIRRRLQAILTSECPRTLITRQRFAASGMMALGIAIPVATFTLQQAQPNRPPYQVIQDSVFKLSEVVQGPSYSGSTVFVLNGQEVDAQTIDTVNRYSILSVEVLTGPAVVRRYGYHAAERPVLIITQRDSTTSSREGPYRQSTAVRKLHGPRKPRIAYGDIGHMVFGPTDRLFGDDINQSPDHSRGATSRDRSQLVQLGAYDPEAESKYFSIAPTSPATLDVLHSKRPGYPEILRSQSIEGIVHMQFVVDATGKIQAESARIISSTHEEFSAAVLAALPSIHFIPATEAGQPVTRVIQYPFYFRAQNDFERRHNTTE